MRPKPPPATRRRSARRCAASARPTRPRPPASGIRVGDLADRAALVEKIRAHPGRRAGGRRLREGGGGPGDARVDRREALRAAGQRLAPYIADTTLLLNDWMDEGQSILFEGAQGTLLDLDHGSYPFVTSSSTVAGGLCAGLGSLAAARRCDLGRLQGLLQPRRQRPDADRAFRRPERLRRDCCATRGREFGTATGRPRRCGWFDGVAAALRAAHQPLRRRSA